MKLLLATDYSLDDIIFESHHQAYGAYALRRACPQHVIKAIAYMFAVVSLFLIVAYVGLAFKSAPLPATRPNQNTITIETAIIPKTEERVIEPPATLSPASARITTPTKRFVISARIPIDKMPVEEALPAQMDFTKVEPGLEEARGDSRIAAIPVYGNPGNAVGNAADNLATEIKGYAEHMPEFPGGRKQLYDFI